MGAVTVLSEEQFLELPESPGKQELIDGRLILLPPAKHVHSEIARRLAGLISAKVDASRVWVEAAYRLAPGRWLIPDVSLSWPGQTVDEWFQGAPMLAIEIASRGNSAEELDEKVALYLEHGAAEVWIVYPKTRSMVVFRQDGAWRVASEYHSELIGVTVTAQDRTAPA